jgi:hypothetical protein
MRTIVVTVMINILMASCVESGKTKPNYESEVTYDEKVNSIEDIELSQFNKFLNVNANYRKNLIGTKIKIDGSITNSATVATYKDVIVKVRYYSITQTELYNEDYTIYNFFPPNTVIDFELKISNYKDVESIGLEVVGATSK